MSIYDSIGGAPAVARSVDDFYARVLADPQLAGYFARVDVARLKAHQRNFIAAAVGRPEIYRGRDTLIELGVPAETVARIGSSLAPLRAEIATSSI